VGRLGLRQAFTDAANTIYEVEEGRPFWKRKPLQLLITFVLILMAAGVALGLVLSGPIAGALGGALGLSDTALSIWRIAKWPAMIALVLVIFGALYFTTPNARVSGLRWVSAGAVIALCIWIAGSVAFAFYAADFGSYDMARARPSTRSSSSRARRRTARRSPPPARRAARGRGAAARPKTARRRAPPCTRP
jgi:membrane protein